MKKATYILALGLALASGTAFAADKEQVYQQAKLKNGTVLYGFIQQNDGLGTLTFRSDSAIVFLENVEADCTDRVVPRSQVMQQWADWADRNTAWQGTADNENLTLSDITVSKVLVKDDNFLEKLKGKQATNVKVLERGVKFKYVEMTPNTYSLTWDDIVSISSERRTKTMLSGIVTNCQTKNGNFEGQYAGETGTTTSLYLDNGVIQTMAKNDVVKFSYRALNPEQTIFEQSRLLDVVNVKDGTPVSGIIIEQNYASGKDTENYILVQQPTGIIQSIKMSEIVNISKEFNSQYNPCIDIVLGEDDVYINGTKASPVSVRSKKGINSLASFTPVVLKKGENDLTKAEVQWSAANVGQNVEAFRLVPLKKNGKGSKATYTFTDESLNYSVYRPSSINTSVNQTTTAVYNLNGGGGFVLYDAKGKTAFCIFVEP